MLKNNLTLIAVKRMPSSQYYPGLKEELDLLDSLSTSEYKVYLFLNYSPIRNLAPEDYSAEAISTELGLAVKTVQNALSALKKKGYANLVWFKDERGSQGVKVIVGKEQMQLYALGLDVCIKDAKLYNELLSKFPVNDPSLDIEKRKALVKEANEYARNSIQKRK